MTRSSSGLLLIAALLALLSLTASFFTDASPAESLAVEARGGLVINGQRARNVAPIMIADNILPGWSGSADIRVANTASTSGRLYFSVRNVVNEDLACAESEPNCEDGQLGANLLISLREGASKIWHGPASVEDMERAGWLDLGLLDAGASRLFQLAAELPKWVGNDVMSDRVTFDIVFSLEVAVPPPKAPPPGPPGQTAPAPTAPEPAPAPIAEVLASSNALDTETVDARPVAGVLAQILPRAGGIPIAGTLPLIGLVLLSLGILLRRTT